MIDTDPIRDATELRRRLGALTFDLRTLDLAGFRGWLDRQMARWQSDPVFVQRSRIRGLRQAHPELRAVEAESRQAAEAVAASPAGPRMAAVDKRLHHAEQAIAGLTAALGAEPPEHWPALLAKRARFVAERTELAAQQEELLRSSPEHQRAFGAAAALRRIWGSVGLDREHAALAALLADRGRDTDQAGASFERDALGQIEPMLRADLGDPSDLHILRTVRLGAAGVELDLVIARRAGGPDEPVEVLAVVEAKRNINDLAHGFLRRQIDLAWLTGDTARYDPAAHRTGHFRDGHFDRPAAHWEDGQAFVFAPVSFGRFARDESSYFRDGLYLLTRAGPIWGVSSARYAQIAARAATDEDWDSVNAAYTDRFFTWCRSLAGPFETPEVIRLYTDFESSGCRLLVLGA